MVECPDGIILKFKHNNCLCKGFPYIDMDNLKDHVFKPSSVAENTFEPITKSDDLGGKLKALKELPKMTAFAFLQTVCQNMEGFTKHKAKGANLARKAQAILGHPTSTKLSQLVNSLRSFPPTTSLIQR